MFLKIVNNIDYKYKQALNYFSIEYVESIKSKESIVSRFLISKEIEKKYQIKQYLPLFSKEKIPLYDNGIFWSISHKDDLVFVGIDNEKIGVDVEIYKERDLSVFNQFTDKEYKLLGGKNWDNFYVLWTAKECVIKYNLLNLEELSKIELLEEKKINKKINELEFSKILVLNYKSSINQVYFGKKDDIFYSVCSNSVVE